MERISVSMNNSGRIVIPSKFRKALGIQPGDKIVLELEPHEIRLSTMRQRLARAQEIVAKYVKPGTRLSDELIAERREAAKHE
jgi:AbrB family looped-hinge helix DNA binding protein